MKRWLIPLLFSSLVLCAVPSVDKQTQKLADYLIRKSVSNKKRHYKRIRSLQQVVTKLEKFNVEDLALICKYIEIRMHALEVPHGV
jgi:hypothetical protein